MKIGFIGTGVMGTGIINNFLTAGYQVTVFNRTQSKAENVISHGAVWADFLCMQSAMVHQPSDIDQAAPCCLFPQ